MANISSALIKLVFKDEDNKEMDVLINDFPKTLMAMEDLSYDCPAMFGDVESNNGNACGRWYYGNNFNWKEQTENLSKAIKEEIPECVELEIEVFDTEQGCAFLSHYKIHFNVDEVSFVEENIEEWSYENFAKLHNIEIPKQPDDEFDDEISEKIQEAYDEIENLFLDMA